MSASVQREVRFKSTVKELDIGEVAALSGIKPSALRFYEKRGLIKPIGRNGLRRQYPQSVLSKLQLIGLGQAAGFSLDEMAAMLNPQGKVAINREQLQQRAKAIDETICKLQLFSEGLKHAARCPAPEHTECASFKKLVSRGLRLIARK